MCEPKYKNITESFKEKDCKTEYVEQCQLKNYKKVCNKVPKEECAYVTKYRSRTVPDGQDCREEPRKVCKDVPKEECKQNPVEKCETVVKKVPVKVSKKVPRKVC